jgi:hypothetical protein
MMVRLRLSLMTSASAGTPFTYNTTPAARLDPSYVVVT